MIILLKTLDAYLTLDSTEKDKTFKPRIVKSKQLLEIKWWRSKQVMMEMHQPSKAMLKTS